jgi:hypothetical protein
MGPGHAVVVGIPDCPETVLDEVDGRGALRRHPDGHLKAILKQAGLEQGHES